MYQVKLETFEGPLSLLLKLIEEEKLDITTVSLAEVTEQYLDRIGLIEERLRPADLADFLVIAAKLLVIKSHLLLPGLAYDEEETGDLERQLRMYKAYRDASRTMRALIDNGRFSYARLPMRITTEQRFREPEGLSVTVLHSTMRAVIREIEATRERLPRKKLEKVISIGERISHLRAMLSSVQQIGFSDFLKTAKNKAEIVVSFLALLELVKQRHLVAMQDDGADIIIEHY